MAEKGVCRIGDHCSGICRAGGGDHPRAFTGTWLTGSSNCTADGIGIVREGDLGITDCGHQITAAGGSSNSTADSKKIHRIGDPVTTAGGGTGTSTSGSTTVLSD